MKSNNVCFFMDILSIVYCPLLALFVVLCWHCAPAPGMTPCGHYVVAKVIKNRDRRQTKSRFSSHHGSKKTVCRFFQSHSVSMGAPLQPLPSSLCPRLQAPCACCLRPCRPRLLRPLSVGMHAFRLSLLILSIECPAPRRGGMLEWLSLRPSSFEHPAFSRRGDYGR